MRKFKRMLHKAAIAIAVGIAGITSTAGVATPNVYASVELTTIDTISVDSLKKITKISAKAPTFRYGDVSASYNK